MLKKIISFALICQIIALSPCSAGFGGFDYEENPAQVVTHAGALLIKKYPANHPDGRGEQRCLLLQHDRNFNSWQPAAGHVDPAKDFEMRDRRRFYLSRKTIQREVLEETGGHVNLTDDVFQKLPLLYSARFRDLLAVVRDDTLSVEALSQSTQRAIADPTKGPEWKEMDDCDAFPMVDVMRVAQIMLAHFEGGGNINNLPQTILSPRRSLGLNTPPCLCQHQKQWTSRSLRLLHGSHCRYLAATSAPSSNRRRTRAFSNGKTTT